MNLQFIADGLLVGAMIGLGAIGVSLTYSILRFANFAHGEFIAWGAYFALALVALIGFLTGQSMDALGPFSFGWPLLVAGLLAMALTGHTAGGPGKVAVVSSSLFGTISGSAVANVMVDGPISIPLMKRSGFPPHSAFLRFD